MKTIEQYLEAKRAFDQAEAELKTLRLKVEPLVVAAGGTLMHGNVEIKLVPTEREVFNLRNAKEKIDGRILRPFISISEYNQLRVKVKL